MRRRALAVCALAGVAVLGLAPAAPAKSRKVAVHTMRLLPPYPNVPIRAQGRTYRSDRRGFVRFPVRVVDAQRARSRTRAGFRKRISVPTTRISKTERIRFDHTFGGKAIAVYVDYLVKPQFRDLRGRPVDPGLVDSMTVKSRTGVRSVFRGTRPLWLQGKRVVVLGGRLVVKEIDYQSEHVAVRGTSVVNRAQQRFFPSRTRKVPIRLLFYSATFTSRDALLGLPLGSAVKLRFPDGRLQEVKLSGGKATVPALPRGEYQVSVKALGMSFTRPLTMSRNQQMELKVVSYLDMVLVLLALLSLAGALLLARRPALRKGLRARARARKRVQVGARGG